MNKAIFKRIGLLSILCIAVMSSLTLLPMNCYGDDCEIGIDVSPYQVNIDSDGEEHYVRVLTYTWYSNMAYVFVYINDTVEPIDSGYIVLTRDSIGHLVVKIDLIALQDAKLEVETYHFLKIVVGLQQVTDKCDEKAGIGEIYIIGKKGTIQSVED